MDPVTMMMVGGTALDILGSWGANIQQSIMEKVNADFYRKQLQHTIQANQRNLDVIRRESGYREGQISTTYGASGLSMSGASASLNLATAMADGAEEILFAKRMGELELERISMAARQADQRASTLQSVGYNLLQGGTKALQAGATYNAAKARETGPKEV